jgi:hypothetical protein
VTEEQEQEPVQDQVPADRRRVVVIAGILVVVLVVAGVLTLLLTGGDDDNAGEDTAGGNQQTTATDTPTEDQQETGAPADPATEAEVTAAKGVAEQAAAAFAAGDVEAMTRISCEPADDETPVDVGENTTAELVGEPVLSGDTGEIQLRISVGGSEPTVVPLPLEKRADGTWCVP